MNEESRMLEEI